MTIHDFVEVRCIVCVELCGGIKGIITSTFWSIMLVDYCVEVG